jgi:hypothetical protein
MNPAYVPAKEGTHALIVRARSKGLAVMPSGRTGTMVYDDVVVRPPADGESRSAC